MAEKRDLGVSERHKDEVWSDNRGLFKCSQCKTCIYWDTGDSWSKYNKGVCQKYKVAKPTAIMRGDERCEFKEIR